MPRISGPVLLQLKAQRTAVGQARGFTKVHFKSSGGNASGKREEGKGRRGEQREGMNMSE